MLMKINRIRVGAEFMKQVGLALVFLVAAACSHSEQAAIETLNETSVGGLQSSEQNSLKIVSWNIANLAEGPGKALRGGYVRSQSDYDVLKDQIAAMDADIIALQEIGSIPTAQMVIDTAEYEIEFETRCKSNRAQCQSDVGDIYTAIAFRKSLPQADVFQLDQLAIPHTDECGETRDVRGGVGVSFALNNQTVHVPSLHIKASCKDDRIESGTEDDCATQRAQFEALNAWMRSIPSDELILLAGDFNRKLLTSNDSVRNYLDAESISTLTYLPAQAERTCWAGTDYQFDFRDLKRKARVNNPDIDAQNVDPRIYSPSSNQLIDFFIMRGNASAYAVSSDQVEMANLYRFENPGNTLLQCDGKTEIRFIRYRIGIRRILS